MKEGRRKVQICLFTVVLAAVVIGLFYYYGTKETETGGEGMLIQTVQDDDHVC